MSDFKGSVRCFGLLVAGAAVGALAGLLLAPASGPETRRRMARRLEDEKAGLLRKGQRVVEDVAERLEERIEEGKRKLSEALRS